MTVKELIEELQKLPQDKKVVLYHRDHTNWSYTEELTSGRIDEEKWYDVELTRKDYELMDERVDNGTYEEDSEYPDVVMIDCNFRIQK
jgi:hypothetical protein